MRFPASERDPGRCLPPWPPEGARGGEGVWSRACCCAAGVGVIAEKFGAAGARPYVPGGGGAAAHGTGESPRRLVRGAPPQRRRAAVAACFSIAVLSRPLLLSPK
jgi:hypothetical protein